MGIADGGVVLGVLDVPMPEVDLDLALLEAESEHPVPAGVTELVGVTLRPEARSLARTAHDPEEPAFGYRPGVLLRLGAEDVARRLRIKRLECRDVFRPKLVSA